MLKVQENILVDGSDEKSNMVLVTGANGFIGKALIRQLYLKNIPVRGLTRYELASPVESIVYVPVGELDGETQYANSLSGVKTIIHTAARVHVMNDALLDPLTEYRKVNTNGTLNLARQAVAAGVKRFIFLSSIKVNGEFTLGDQRFCPNDSCSPKDPYAQSKYEAEQGLIALSKEENIEVVIIRPPLVYGPGVKANFVSMVKWAGRGIPLPLGSVVNRRSFVALDNLVDLIILCINHPKAANQIFLVSDGEDISTPELIRKTARAFSKNPILFPVPVRLMTAVLKLLGKDSIAKRLFASLRIDSGKTRELLGWVPIVKMDEQLKILADKYFVE